MELGVWFALVELGCDGLFNEWGGVREREGKKQKPRGGGVVVSVVYTE